MLTVWTVARVTALGRLALAISLFFLCITESDDAGFEIEPDDLMASAYLLVALYLVAVAWRSWWLDFKLQPWALAMDVLTFIVQPSLLHPEHDGYRIAALTLATFVILSTALRWNWRLAAMIAVGLNLSNFALQDYHPVDFNPHLHSYRAQLRSSYFLLVISIFIVWVASRISAPRAASFRLSDNTLDRQGLLKEALEFTLGGARASSGSICWRELGEGKCAGVIVQRFANSGARESPDCTGYDFASGVQASLFDLDTNRCLTLLANGDIKAMSGQNWIPSPAISRSGFRKGAAIPITRRGSGLGLLIVADCRTLSVDLLRFLVAVGDELCAEFNRFRSAKFAREEELGRLRNALARDLHDSVVQSIAGTRYWLSSLGSASRTDKAFNDDLRRFDDALANEADHLRTTIEKLRLGNFAATKKDVAADLQSLAVALSDQWRTEITLIAPQDADRISRDLTFEVRQMIREAVSNAVRHGSATLIAINLSIKGDRLCLAIRDNGNGFHDRGDYGNPRMLETRAQDLKGHLTLETTAQGTTVTLDLPMESDH